MSDGLQVWKDAGSDHPALECAARGDRHTEIHTQRKDKKNLDIWDFSLGEEDMAKIATLDKGCPSMLDTRKISEIRRVYDYLDNPVLTSL